MENTNTALQVLNFEQQSVRIVMKEGNPWWVAKDVCDLFGETNRNRAMQALDEDEKGYTQMNTPGGMQRVAIVDESGLYSLLLVMQPSKARGVSAEYITQREVKLKSFRRWVTHEVLPSIRKHGAYLTPQKIEEIILNPDTVIQLAQTLKAEQEKVKALEAQAAEDAPRVLLAKAIETSVGSILVGDFAKILKQNGIDIGQNRLFAQLRERGYLIKKKGDSWNMPTQQYMNKGYFEVKESTIYRPNGDVVLTKVTKITGAGQLHLINAFMTTN